MKVFSNVSSPRSFNNNNFIKSYNIFYLFVFHHIYSDKITGKKMKKNLFYFILIMFIISSLYCQEKDINLNTTKIISPVETDDGWKITSLKNVNIDSIKLQTTVDKICDGTLENIHSVVIVKEGKLVFERYFSGYKFKYDAKEFKGEFTEFNQNQIHNLASVTKSITSILFGIARDKGFIDSVNVKVFNFFPKYSYLNDSLKDKITLWHLLTMTSGLKWNEQDIFYSEVENDIIQLFIVQDPVKYILSKPMIHPAGTNYYYNGGNTNLLGKIIQETSGFKLDEFAKKYLFDPLGIRQYEWLHIKPDMVYASGDLKLRPRDMAKIGYMMLNNGKWKSNKIVSQNWIEESITPYVHFNGNDGYGYQWWIKKYELGNTSFNSFAAEGWGGQNIIVFPDLDVVVVITGGNYITRTPNNEIIYRYILPAVDENFKYNFEKIKKEAPIGEEFKIIKPSIYLRNSIAKLSGHWYGRGDYSIADQLVVEKIDSTAASIIYSWGTHPNGYFKNGWVRKIAEVDPEGIIKFTLDNNATLTFKLEENGNTLVGYYKLGNIISKLIMNRV